jgi:hypothetical protein
LASRRLGQSASLAIRASASKEFQPGWAMKRKFAREARTDEFLSCVLAWEKASEKVHKKDKCSGRRARIFGNIQSPLWLYKFVPELSTRYRRIVVLS